MTKEKIDKFDDQINAKQNIDKESIDYNQTSDNTRTSNFLKILPNWKKFKDNCN